VECAVWMYYRLTPPRERRNELARYEGSKAPRQNNNRTQPQPLPSPSPLLSLLLSLPSTTCALSKSSRPSPSSLLLSHENDVRIALLVLVCRTDMKLAATGDSVAEEGPRCPNMPREQHCYQRDHATTTKLSSSSLSLSLSCL